MYINIQIKYTLLYVFFYLFAILINKYVHLNVNDIL